MSSENSSRTPAHSPVTGFGTNEWLVEEMYQQYVADPSSVDQAWHEFFADYRPMTPSVSAAAAASPASSPMPYPSPSRMAWSISILIASPS